MSGQSLAHMFFSDSYETATSRFTILAEAANARRLSAPIPHSDDAIELALLGDARAKTLVIHSSGVHGVEGYVGSAIQLAILEERPRVNDTLAVLFIHVVNPSGMRLGRRWTANHVDLNRNFFETVPNPDPDPLYPRIDAFLNPQRESALKGFLPKALLLIARYGYNALQQAVAQGQFHAPKGLFYGGRDPEPETQILLAAMRALHLQPQVVMGLDVHAGLGQYGEHRLLLEPFYSQEQAAVLHHILDHDIIPVSPGSPRPSGVLIEMVQRLPIYASHSEEIIAYAQVDDDDYAHLAAYRWVMPGTPESPGTIYRARCVGERAAHEHPALVLSQEIVPHSGHISFRNGNRLDYRKANLVTSHERQQRLEHGAEVLRRMNRLHAPQPGRDASVTLPLTQGWTACIDAEWEDDVRRYHWYVARRGTHVYAQRQRKQGRLRTIIALARVIAGLQDIDSGERLRPGVVAYQTPADVDHQLLDLRRTNLLITTRGGVTLRRPHSQRYRGVHAVGRTGRYRATLSIDGHYRILGLYDTPEEAAQAQDAAIIRLGLQDIAQLNNP